MQYEIEAKAARLKAQRKEEEEVSPTLSYRFHLTDRDERDRKQLVKKLEHWNSRRLMKL
jgi:hypothetical protein